MRPRGDRLPPRRRPLALVPFVLAVALFAPARASASCGIGVWSGVAFGTYDVFSASPLDSTGLIVYWCSGESHIRITLTRGSSPTYDARTLRSGASVLEYNLYLNAARTTVWGDGTGKTHEFHDSHPPEDWFAFARIYGRVPPAQDARAGVYSDTIQAVIDF